MSAFDEYANKYKTARMERRNGVLQVTRVLARAWQLAEDLARKPTLLLRYTRLLFTEYLRRQMHDLLGYGLAMESLALFEKPEGPATPGAR